MNEVHDSHTGYEVSRRHQQGKLKIELGVRLGGLVIFLTLIIFQLPEERADNVEEHRIDEIQEKYEYDYKLC